MSVAWIPTEEKLPPKGELVLAYAPKGETMFAGMLLDAWPNTTKWYIKSAMGSLKTMAKKVTHWMPLPVAPSEFTKVVSDGAHGGQNPACFIPQQDVVFPLCVGRGEHGCSTCVLNENMPNPWAVCGIRDCAGCAFEDDGLEIDRCRSCIRNPKIGHDMYAPILASEEDYW